MPREVAEEPRESGSSGPSAFWRRGLSCVLLMCWRFVLRLDSFYISAWSVEIVKARFAVLEDLPNLLKFSKVEAVSWVFDVAFVVSFLFFEDFGRVLLGAESGATDSRSLEPRMASCQWGKWQEKDFQLDDFPHSSRVSSFFLQSLVRTHPIKTMEKSKENSGFCHFFSWKICIVSVQFGRGTLGKLLENPATASCFLWGDKSCFFIQFL